MPTDKTSSRTFWDATKATGNCTTCIDISDHENSLETYETRHTAMCVVHNYMIIFSELAKGVSVFVIFFDS